MNLEGVLTASGIYAISHIQSGKLYIGSAVNISKRKSVHVANLRTGKHHSIKLQRAWNKYGEESFEFKTLLVCDKKDLLFYEQRLIDGYDVVNAGYNVCPTAGSCIGVKQTAEDRAKKSAAMKGNKSSIGVKQSPEHIAKRVAAHLGRKHSEESRAKMSAAHSGVSLSEAHRAAISKGLIGNKYGVGRKPSAESIAKRLETLKANKISKAVT
jgi:group I intron endonuclease